MSEQMFAIHRDALLKSHHQAWAAALARVCSGKVGHPITRISPMTQSLRGASAGTVGEESLALHQQFATEIAVERTRLLYQGSQVPTLFMLLGGLTLSLIHI